jgi:EAL domain-containing protein (putative c-di-GMP-specific phosphodiesterase class I)
MREKELTVHAVAVQQSDHNYAGRLQLPESRKVSSAASWAIDNAKERLELEHIIVFKQIMPVFQPIVSLEDGHVHGHESLSRLTHDGFINNPEDLFDKARLHGLTSEIEKLCREKALSQANELKLHGMIFLNVCPALMLTEGYRPGFTLELLNHLGIDRSRIVFELTEKTLIDDYALFEKGVGHYRSQGFKIAIDDLGDGYAGLKMLSQIVPDYVKLAQFLVSDIDSSPSRQALAEALVCFSKKIGAQVIAEGIERPEELAYFTSIGAEFGQGYLIARPSPCPSKLHKLDLPVIGNMTAHVRPHLHCRLSSVRAACP